MDAWCITEGKAGMINQVEGLASALDASYVHLSVRLRPLWRFLPNGMYPSPRYAIENIQEFSPSKCPSLVITCGKRSVYASLYLKSHLRDRVTTIHIQNPNIAPYYFDYIIAPCHDRLSGSNVISSQLALNHITQSRLTAAAQQLNTHFKLPPRSLTLVILGGINRHFHFTVDAMSTLKSQLAQHIQDDNAYCVIVPSRRTPTPIIEDLKLWSQTTPYSQLWLDSRINPYLGLLSQCDRTIITGDSSSMISESITAKKPTYIFQLPPKRRVSRITEFHRTIFAMAWAHPLSLPLPPCRLLNTPETQSIAHYLRTQLAEV